MVLKDIIQVLLYADGSDEPGTGTIRQDAYSRYNGERNCFMKEEEWVDDGEGGYQVQTENQYKALEYVNVLFQSPILENQRMYAVPNAVGLMIPYYHQPNNIFGRDGGGYGKRKGIDVPIEKTRRKNTICRSLCCNISKETAFYFV